MCRIRLALPAVVLCTSIIISCGGSPNSSPTPTETKSLVSVSISPSAVPLAVGATQQLNATGKFSDGTTVNMNAMATWSSSNTAVATVKNGLVTAVSTGSATITATVSGKVASSMITVMATAPT